MIMNSFHASVPSENWDDDFEFQQQASSTNQRKANAGNRMSIASSHFTDWDAGHEENEENDDGDNTRPVAVLEDKKNLTHWAEHQGLPGPSYHPQTPTRRAHGPSGSTENWDDDFEDSPARPTASSNNTSPSRPFPAPPQAKSPSKRGGRRATRPESWDDEFGGPAAGKKSPGRRGLQHSPGSSEDESELGYARGDADGDEDRTVTARSRRQALSRLTASIDNTPPPPVPALPHSFLVSTNNAPSTSTNAGASSSTRPHTSAGAVTTQPFPRSPSASVFSIPSPIDYHPSSSVDAHSTDYSHPSPTLEAYGYARPPSSAYTATSTTYLRPTMSRSSSRLDALPPSPPIHRERERRRLRKKSRPAHVQGVVIEMGPLRLRDEGSFDEEMPDEAMERTPSPPPDRNASIVTTGVIGPASSMPSIAQLPSTPSGKGGALLSRIGSVKKWGVRRKRGGSTTPSEVLAGGVSVPRLDTGSSLAHDANLTPRPRPHSQASTSFPSSGSESHSSTGHHGTSTSSHQLHDVSFRSNVSSKRASTSSSPHNSNTNWFFRSSSSPLTALGNRNFALGAGSNSSSDLSFDARQDYIPDFNEGSKAFPASGARTNPRPPHPETPTKLVKRKSLGFVQLRRGFGGHGDEPNPSDVNGDDKGKRPASVQPPARHVSYGGLGLGRAGMTTGGKEGYVPTDQEQERMRGSSERAGAGGEKEKEGSRGFMGSVRKLSLVGRHKRTKSGVSLSGVEEIVGVRDIPPPPTPHLNPNIYIRDNPDREQTPQPKNRDNPLLPPIELQPPSPPRLRPVKTSTSAPASAGAGGVLSPAPSSTSSMAPLPTSPTTPSRRPKAPGSPQAASLGRSTIGPLVGGGSAPTTTQSSGTSAAVLRRNSLGDLKIPDRISQAQVGLRRDLGMVREFAANVEQLKELQKTYHSLVVEVDKILDSHLSHPHPQPQLPAQPRPTSPSFLQNLSQTKSRRRSNTNPTPTPATPSSSSLLSTSPSTNNVTQPPMAYKQLASSFYTINSKYRISWECAELLIELGSGSSGNTTAPSTSVSAPVIQYSHDGRKVSRERAITLAGDESKPPTPTSGSTGSSGAASGIRGVSPPLASPPSLAWRASTGRHDLNHRQLVLLKEMLNNAESASHFATEEIVSGSIPEEPYLPQIMLSVNRDWRWGDAMSSTVTLPSEDSGAGGNIGGPNSTNKKRRGSRLGMSGLRDMLRSLKRSHAENPPLPAVPMSSTSLSTDNSSLDHRYPHPHVPPTQGRRRAKTSSGPDSVRASRPTSPYSPSSLSSKPSPRRPSLASIFRLGHKSKTLSPPADPTLDSGDNTDHARGRSASGGESVSTSTGEEEDWDRLDSASDLDAAARALGIGRDGSATIRGKGPGRSPYLQDAFPPPLPVSGRPLTPKRSASGSQSSIWGGGESPSGGMPPPLPHARSTRLSNVEEHTDDPRQTRSSSKHRHSKIGASPSRPPSRATKNGSVRSMPPQPVSSSLPDPKLAMTPENIKPLLENAKEVHIRLNDCIAEIRLLLSMYAQDSSVVRFR